jgi:threonine synthase
MSQAMTLRCIRCGAESPLRLVAAACPACGDARANLRAAYAESAADRWARVSGAGFWRYAPMLPAAEGAVSLHEGATPLVAAGKLGREIGVDRLFLKDESRNPTWSYKDRLSTVAVSAACGMGAPVLATSSSGNAGASLAAYAARAGMPCVVITFAGTAGPMLAQIRKYGPTVVSLAHKQDRWPVLAECVRRFGWFAASPYSAPVAGSHALGIEGYKTIAYEIYESFDGQAPDWVVMPVCYGDALAGVWYGFQELKDAGVIERLPRMVAAEVFGSLGAALGSGGDHVPDMRANFAALAVSVGATQSAFQALNVLRQSGGTAVTVGNDGLIDAQERLAATEGVFAELTSVMPIVAIERLRRSGVIARGDSVVAVVTASGLKDIDKSASEAASTLTGDGSVEGALRFLADRFDHGARQKQAV